MLWSSESLSHLIASVFILQERKTAENRNLFWENDEAQTQNLGQGRIIKKIDIFHQKFGSFGNLFFLKNPKKWRKPSRGD